MRGVLRDNTKDGCVADYSILDKSEDFADKPSA